MSRIIKFRGKNNNKEWVYGLPTITPIGAGIISENGMFDIDESTLGETTGMYDKNKVECFEGDNVRFFVKKEEIVGVIIFKNGKFLAHTKKREYDLYKVFNQFDGEILNEGNI